VTLAPHIQRVNSPEWRNIPQVAITMDYRYLAISDKTGSLNL